MLCLSAEQQYEPLQILRQVLDAVYRYMYKGGKTQQVS